MKPWTIVHGFWPENEKFEFGKKRIPSERASQEHQNGANFNFIAPSSEELWVQIPASHLNVQCMVKVVTAYPPPPSEIPGTGRPRGLGLSGVP